MHESGDCFLFHRKLLMGTALVAPYCSAWWRDSRFTQAVLEPWSLPIRGVLSGWHNQVSINIFIVIGRGKGDSGKIEAEAATPCWLQPGSNWAFLSPRALSESGHWLPEAEFTVENSGLTRIVFPRRGPVSPYFLLLPPSPFFMFTSVEAE